jgi:hypothetical protein
MFDDHVTEQEHEYVTEHVFGTVYEYETEYGFVYVNV